MEEIKLVLTNQNFISAILLTICLIFIGFILTRTKIIPHEAEKVLTSIIMKVAFPCLAFIGFLSDFDISQFGVLILSFICFLILVVREKVENSTLQTILVVLLVCVTIISDWAILAAIFTILFDEWKGDRKKIWDAYKIAIGAFGVMNLLGNLDVYSVPKAILCALGSCMGILCSGLVIQYLYNGKRAMHGRTISKWFFYIFYPAHLLLLGYLAL